MLNYMFEELSKQEIRAAVAWRLHYERITANLSLEALAEKTGYSKPTVQRWEKGWEQGTGDNIIPTMDQLMSLCAIYNCTPEYLLCEYDEKTKAATDIALETGLTEDTVAVLQRYFQPLLTGPGGANDLFLSFLNYFIGNMTLLMELIFNRSILTYTQESLQEDPDKDIIIEAFNAITSSGLSVDIFKDAIFKDNAVSKMLMKQQFKDYFLSKGFDEERSSNLAESASEYLDVLSSSKVKQSDFALSDTFLDLIKGFFANMSDRTYEYHQFVDRQKAKYSQSDPEEESTAP